ncbi:MAG: hypothetical protein WAT19_16045 [Ferruginibacter sp.]
MLKILVMVVVLTGIMKPGFADRGVGKKKSNKILIDLPSFRSGSKNLSFNLKSGVKYKGSFSLSNNSGKSNGSATTLVTYQKGSNVYIIPYKQKILVPEVKQGYTGLKLIIKRN